MPKVRWEVGLWYELCSKLHTLPNGRIFLKIGRDLTKLERVKRIKFFCCEREGFQEFKTFTGML